MPGVAWAIPLPGCTCSTAWPDRGLPARRCWRAGDDELGRVGTGGVGADQLVLQRGDHRGAPKLLGASVAAGLVLLVNLVVFTGVGVSMVERLSTRDEHARAARNHDPIWFLGLVAAIGGQLFYLFGLFAL